MPGEWRKQHNEELNDLYSSPNIVRMIKSRRMIWLGRVARVGERRGVYSVLVGKAGGKRTLGRPRDGRIMVRWIFRKWVWGEGGIKYITLARDKDRWREFVNPVMKLWVP